MFLHEVRMRAHGCARVHGWCRAPGEPGARRALTPGPSPTAEGEGSQIRRPRRRGTLGRLAREAVLLVALPGLKNLDLAVIGESNEQ
jgi:hypothetical protein